MPRLPPVMAIRCPGSTGRSFSRSRSNSVSSGFSSRVRSKIVRIFTTSGISYPFSISSSELMTVPPSCKIPIPQQVQYTMEEFSESTVTGENPDKSCKKSCGSSQSPRGPCFHSFSISASFRNHCHAFHFHQASQRQPADLDTGSGGESLLEIRLIDFIDFAKIIHILQKDRCLDDLIITGTGRFQNGARFRMEQCACSSKEAGIFPAATSMPN